MLKRAEKNVLFTIFATALIGLTGMRTSFSGESSNQVRQSMEDTYKEKTCGIFNGKLECVDSKPNKVEDAVERPVGKSQFGSRDGSRTGVADPG